MTGTWVLDRARVARAADIAAVLVAASLPWSTSATGILVVVWLVLVLPTLDLPSARATLGLPAAVLPILLWGLAVLGLVWADVSWSERIAGLRGFNKLLVIPVLIMQFKQSEHGHWVLIGFAASAVALALVSWVLALLPGLTWRGKGGLAGIPVKDYLSQSAICMIAAFALLGFAHEQWRRGKGRIALAMVLLAAVLLANILYVATGRTALVVIPVLAWLLAGKAFGWRGMIGAAIAGAVLAGLVWTSSPYLRDRVLKAVDEVRTYQSEGAITSAGLRLEFWKKSVGFIAEAPVIGNGTGTIPDRFRRVAGAGDGAASVASVNPHNQVLAVAVELGVVGTAVLLAMWLAHLALFRSGGLAHVPAKWAPVRRQEHAPKNESRAGSDSIGTERALAAWVGLVVVVQNMISSAFNSHLFDFTHGWLYVVGVGVAGGMVLRRRPAREAPNAVPRPA